MLGLFYFAIPVGSGLGYIVGSETARAFGSWQWGLRVTPGLGLLAVLFVVCQASNRSFATFGSWMWKQSRFQKGNRIWSRLWTRHLVARSTSETFRRC